MIPDKEEHPQLFGADVMQVAPDADMYPAFVSAHNLAGSVGGHAIPSDHLRRLRQGFMSVCQICLDSLTGS